MSKIYNTNQLLFFLFINYFPGRYMVKNKLEIKKVQLQLNYIWNQYFFVNKTEDQNLTGTHKIKKFLNNLELLIHA